MTVEVMNLEVSGDVMRVSNDISETMSITMNFGLDDPWNVGGGKLNFNLGNAYEVGDGSYNAEFGRMLTVKRNENEIEEILDALLVGDGIDGLEVKICSDSSVQVLFSNGETTDYLNLGGQFIEEYLADLNSGHRPANVNNQFNFVDDTGSYSINLQKDDGLADELNVLKAVAGQTFDSNGTDLETVMAEYVADEMDLTNIYTCETDDPDLYTVVIQSEGSSLDTIVVENVDADIIPAELLGGDDFVF